jgi:hypothetical protein
MCETISPYTDREKTATLCAVIRIYYILYFTSKKSFCQEELSHFINFFMKNKKRRFPKLGKWRSFEAIKRRGFLP